MPEAGEGAQERTTRKHTDAPPIGERTTTINRTFIKAHGDQPMQGCRGVQRKLKENSMSNSEIYNRLKAQKLRNKRSEAARKANATRKRNKAEQEQFDAEQKELRAAEYNKLSDELQGLVYRGIHEALDLDEQLVDWMESNREAVRETVRQFLRSGISAAWILAAAEENGLHTKWEIVGSGQTVDLEEAILDVSIEPEFQSDEYLFLADKFVYSKKAAAN